MVYPIKIKKSKIKQRRRRVAFLILCLLLLLAIYFILHAKNYEKKYSRNDFTIKETFDKDLKWYTFEIKKENKVWTFAVPHSYIHSKKLISQITLLEEGNTSCILLESAKLNTYPQCIQDNKQIDAHLVNDNMKKLLNLQMPPENQKETYEKVDIQNLDENTYYLWNYKGFYQISQKRKAFIPIFEKDIYDISQVIQLNRYLVIPDYNSNYYFNRFYILDMKDGNTETWDFKESIYFDGYYLGKYKQSLFYVDKKNKIEWEINPKKEKMRKVGTPSKNGKILENGEWNKISMNKLASENYAFKQKSPYEITIDNGLWIKYLNTSQKKKISNQKVKEIVAIMNEKIYYLVGDSLYSYNEEIGEVLIMNYFEWNFNFKNMIFIIESK